MTDLTTSKPMNDSADDADVAPKDVTEGDRAMGDTSKSTDRKSVV